MATVVLLGTCDTKLEQLLFLRARIQDHPDVRVLLIDAGRTNTEHEAIDISQAELIAEYGRESDEGGSKHDGSSNRDDGQDVSQMPRGELIKFMSGCVVRAVAALHAAGRIHGAVAAGGSGGTALAAPAMRDALPLGFPKLLVSTVASGDVGPIVGESDIAMLHSVVDVAGMNSLLREVLGNAGAAIAGAAAAYARRTERARTAPPPSGPDPSGADTRRVAITMFGVTTPGVDAAREHLETAYASPVETFVFHATGTGGRAMERLVREGRLHGVLDLTTTEVCDLVSGGVMNAGPTRLSAAAEAGLPNVVSLGATDMSNFGPRQTVPERYKERRLYEHNPVVTLMRTDEEEAIKIGRFICEKLRRAKEPGMVEVWIPKGGVSLISTPGGPFEDAKADDALFRTVREGLKGSGITVVDDERAVNDEGFARDIADALAKKMGLVAKGIQQQ